MVWFVVAISPGYQLVFAPLAIHNAEVVNLFRQVDYAIRCIIYMCGTRERLATKGEISKSVSAPDLFVAKILQRLVRAGIVLSVRGVRGGFVLARDPASLSLLDVIEACQAMAAPRPCVVNPRACVYRETCPVHPVWAKIHRSNMRELRKVTFAALVKDAKRLSKSRRASPPLVPEANP